MIVNLSDKVILFDLDGTLLDSTDAIVGTCFDVFKNKKFEHSIDDEFIKSLIGYPLEAMFSMCGVAREYVDDFVLEYKRIYRQISFSQTYLLPMARETLELAASFARLGIVTTKTGAYTSPLLEHLGIGHFFETLVGREHVVMPKPHPEPIFKALHQMGKEIDENIWMVGDTKLDIMAANDAKIKAVGVLSGYGKKDELEKICGNIFETSFDAINFIKTTFGERIKRFP